MKPLRFLLLALLCVACTPRHKPPPAVPTGVNHHIEDTFKALVSTKAFDKVLPAGWSFETFASGRDSVTVGYEDKAKVMHKVELLLKPPADFAPAGKGHFFTFRVLS